jgi:hypothetical protein
LLDRHPRVGERLRRVRTFGDENVQPTAGGLTINRASETQVFGRQKTNGAEGQFSAPFGLLDGVDRDRPSTRREEVCNPLLRPLSGVYFASRHTL